MARSDMGTGAEILMMDGKLSDDEKRTLMLINMQAARRNAIADMLNLSQSLARYAKYLEDPDSKPSGHKSHHRDLLAPMVEISATLTRLRMYWELEQI